MSFGNYNGYGYGYPQYSTNMGYQQFQQPMSQNIMQQQIQTAEVPFSEMHFGTMKEAEAHIVAPNKAVLFLNNPLGEIYVKSADGMGNPSFKTYKLAIAENSTQELDSKNFVKYDDLKDFIKREDLTNFATLDDLKKLQKEISDDSKGD